MFWVLFPRIIIDGSRKESYPNAWRWRICSQPFRLGTAIFQDIDLGKMLFEDHSSSEADGKHLIRLSSLAIQAWEASCLQVLPRLISGFVKYQLIHLSAVKVYSFKLNPQIFRAYSHIVPPSVHLFRLLDIPYRDFSQGTTNRSLSPRIQSRLEPELLVHQ